MGTVAPDGKPGATRVKVVGHFSRQPQASSASANLREQPLLYSLLVLRLITGRSHQIRAHMQYLGHPVVCDAKYTDAATFAEDCRWCARNFLHRYRLAFAE